jgi:hypothetical protein
VAPQSIVGGKPREQWLVRFQPVVRIH